MGWYPLKITADTNLLVRSAVRDDHEQAQMAERVLALASTVAITLPSLCEFVWVLSRSYKLPNTDISLALSKLLDAGNVVVDEPAVEAGLAALESGADFADGVIAYEGGWLGGETFVSFDRKAVSALTAQGVATRLLR